MSKFIFEQEVYSFQIDFAHHVNNIIYVQWMEIGRIKLFEHIGLPVEELAKEDILPILIRTEIDYKRALYYDDLVRIEVWISKLRNVSVMIKYNFFNGKDELAAVGCQTGLLMKLSTKKPIRLSSKERNAFEKVLIEDN